MTRTVLTLTTSPQRMQHLPLVLDALFNQLTSPDAVYLNLPERYRNRDAYIIPDWLGDALQVTLLHRVDDLGPMMKILLALLVQFATAKYSVSFTTMTKPAAASIGCFSFSDGT